MGIGYYFQYTLNDYEAERYEPNIPPLKNRIEMFKTLSGLIGPKKVIWRFDPLILSDVISIERLVEKVYGVMSQIVGHTEKLVFSFLKADKQVRVAQNLTQKGIKYRAFAPEEIGFIVDHLDQMSKEFKIEVSSCAEELEQSPCKINQNKCIDDGLMKRLFSDKEPLIKFIDEYKNLKDPGQRKLCKCVRSVDIGKKNTCRHFCPYCYANTSEKAVMNNFKRINPTAEMLLPPKANILTGGEKNPNKDLPN